MYYQYTYDELGQLIREDNKDANKSYTYTYDSRGNILEKKTYAFTLGTLGTAQKTDSYGYATDSWKDRLTSYNGQTITYDAIGNPLTYNNGSAYTFTWEGRQMQTATKGNTTWTYTYNADGLRTGKTNGTTTYTYTWNENRQLSSMVYGTSSAWFYYDHEGKPLYMEYADGNDECSGTYRYILNLQGDVVGLYDLTRDCMAMTYTYDAWGRELSWSTLNSGYAGLLYGNPLTYRGYIYDRETGFYYLQSRYYDPAIGRFLNADDVVFLGMSKTIDWNLYVYCCSNPVNCANSTGKLWWFLIPVAGIALTLLTGCSSGKYAPQYNTLYKDLPNKANYNCYAYSLGITNRRINPGHFSGKSLSLNIDILKDNVLADLKELGYKKKIVGQKYKPSRRETMIALRTGPNDYHFMLRMSDGSWTHKPGRTAILKLKGNPWDYPVWNSEYYDDGGWATNKTLYYNSKIYYIVYWR